MNSAPPPLAPRPLRAKSNPLTSWSAPVSLTNVFIGLAIAALIIVGMVVAGLVADATPSVEDRVASDAIAQYRIAERSGTAVDRCVHAGLVSAAYIQAKDEEHYAEWKRIEAVDCRAAGMPE